MSQEYRDRESAVEYYEHLVNEILRTKLKLCLEKREACCTEIQEYSHLETSLKSLKDIDTDPLKTKVDLGCSFFVQAEVTDISKVFTAVGFGFFLELTQDEAITFIKKKIAFLNQKVEKLEQEAATIQADIKKMLDLLAQLQNLNSPVISSS